MFDRKSVTQLLAWVIALVVGVSAAYAGEPLPAPRQPPSALEAKPNTKAVVTGTAEGFAAFHQALVTYLKKPSIQDAGVGCLGCDKVENDLQTQKPMRRYTFVASNDTVSKFTAAWIDARSRDQTLTLALSAHEQPEPDCSGKPLPCAPNYFCPNLGNCSATRPACKACGT